MGESTRLRWLVLAALVLLGAPAATQPPAEQPTATPAERAAQRPRRTLDVGALRRAISRLPAAAVAPAATPTPATATEASPAAESPAATLQVQLDEQLQVVPAAALRAREFLYVPLEKAQEADTREAVMLQMQAIAVPTPTATPPPGGDDGPTPLPTPAAVATPPPPQVALFDGAIRTLAATGNELTLKAVARSGMPLTYVASSDHFEGSIKVGVVEVGGQGRANRLTAPILFEVNGPLVATPAMAEVVTTGFPYQTVKLVGNPVDTTVEVEILSSVTPEGVTFTVPVLPALRVRVTPQKIQGWGLETADVVVQARALHAGANRQVQLTADAGNLDKRVLTLDANGTAETSIRSASTGPSTVRASGPTFAEATVPIEFVFPAWFLAAGLLGGLAGGALRIGVPRRATLNRTLVKLGLAVICGFVVLGLYLLGVNVVGFQLPARAGEVLVFVVSALGALGGVALLKARQAKDED